MNALVALYVPYYLYRSMRRVRGESRLLTFAKLSVLTWAYVVSAILMFMVTLIYSTATL